MAFSTKAFDLFYKRIGPTGSFTSWSGNLPEDWFDIDTATAIRVSSSFLNFPDDAVIYRYATTRDSTSAATRTYRALPWGSHACDFLWNATVPSWSYTDGIDQVYPAKPPYTNTVKIRSWEVSLKSSQSFHKINRGATAGVDAYNITSSWNIYDGKFSNSANLRYLISASTYPATSTTFSVFPTYVGSPFAATDKSNTVAYDITYPTMSSNATSSDGQYFDQGGGVGITRASIQASLTTASISGSINTTAGLRHLTEALKARRLFFPTPYSGSGTSGGTDYWLRAFSGYRADEIFTDNGGIYNIQLTLKRDVTADYYPDSNTFMTAFIHNVIPTIPATSGRVVGADGWYPPDTNIATIGNGYGTSPVMTFYDLSTGYLVEKFNFNIIQYGYPAQFCLEASGSLTDNAFFGIIVDDLQICKVGITTDPRFIKPTSIGSTVTQGGGGSGEKKSPIPDGNVGIGVYGSGYWDDEGNWIDTQKWVDTFGIYL